MYAATGTIDGTPWAVSVHDDGTVAATILIGAMIATTDWLDLTPTGPSLPFDPRDPAHLRHYLSTVADDMEEYGDIPDALTVPALPPGTVG